MKKCVCKYLTSTWHDERCAAGVRYDDVCPRPDDTMGKGLRIECPNHNKRRMR